MSDMYQTAAVMIEAETRNKLESVTTAEDALAVTFKAARNHWMFTDEQVQFKGAIGAALIRLKEGPEFERLMESVRALGRISALLNALQNGVPVDMDGMLKEQEARGPQNLVPLQKMWAETRG